MCRVLVDNTLHPETWDDTGMLVPPHLVLPCQPLRGTSVRSLTIYGDEKKNTKEESHDLNHGSR